MLKWHIESKQLELKYTWKISRNSADTKTNLFIQVAKDQHVGIGEAAPNSRYNETVEILRDQFEELVNNGLELVKSLGDLQILLQLHPPANALRFGIESAYIHLICQQQRITVSEFLGVELPASVTTAITVPIMEPGLVPEFIRKHNLNRFQFIKVKVTSEYGLDLVQQVMDVCNRPLIIDANEAWNEPESLLQFLELLRPYPISFIEQPLPAAKEAEYIYLKQKTPYKLFADESITNQADFNLLKNQFHGVNMKLMKAGGYLNGLSLLEQSRQHGLKTMVGCMVETSLGIWSAMQLCHNVNYVDLDGFLVLKNEPFGIVQEQDGSLFVNNRN